MPSFPICSQVEMLESRRMLSAVLSKRGLLRVNEASGSSDIITVVNDVFQNTIVVTENGVATSFPNNKVKRIEIVSGDGADSITVSVVRPTIIWSGLESDTILCGSGRDTIYAGDGDDIIDTGGGSARIYAGEGDDSVVSGSSIDIIYGGGGNDTIISAEGNDTIYGQLGDDSIQTEAGDDRVFGGDGDDVIEGGDGNDQLFGQFGNDSISGEDGNDTISGIKGPDTLFGGNGNDVFVLTNASLATAPVNDFNLFGTDTLAEHGGVAGGF